MVSKAPLRVNPCLPQAGSTSHGATSIRDYQRGTWKSIKIDGQWVGKLFMIFGKESGTFVKQEWLCLFYLRWKQN